jgi:signal transduction histidine kinase/CheY-like chemotaxis protein/ligand-binding sensor domain-containing protein/AraC-like DNA-binding protein
VLSKAQEQEKKFFTITNGLSSNNVNCLTEDYQGFLWVGTDNGLCRFDGNEFNILKNLGSDSTNLIDQKILFLKETDDLQLIIGTSKGFNLLSQNREVLLTVQDTTLSEEQRLPESILALDSETFVWANRTGVFIHKNGTTKTIRLKEIESPTINQLINVRLFKLDSSRFMLSAGKRHVYTFDHEGKILNHFEAKNDFDVSSVDPQHGLIYTIRPFRSSKLNSIILETYKVSGELVKQSSINDHIPNTSQGWFTYMCADDKGHFWLETNQGSFFVNTKPKSNTYVATKHFTVPDGSPSLMQSKAMVFDRNENCWIATSTGLLCIPMKRNYFNVIRPNHFTKDQVFSTRMICPIDENNFLVSSYSGNFTFEKQSNSVEKTQLKNDRLLNTGNFVLMGQMPLNEDEFLVGSDGPGLLKLNVISKKISAARNDSLSPFYVLGIEHGDKDDIWIASHHGIFHYNSELGQISLPPGLDSTMNQKLAYVFDLHYDAEMGVLWCATGHGLAAYSTHSEDLTFYNVADTNNSIAVNSAYCIYTDSKALWLGTYNSGLARFDITTKEIVFYNTDQGLSNNTVFSILSGPDSTLWLGTANGLSVFSRSTGQFNNFYKDDGIADNEFNRLSQYKDKDGTLYMGGIKGVTAFKPSEVLKNFNKSKIRLSSITKHNGKRKIDEEIIFQIDALKQLDIQATDRYFIVNFTEEDLMNQDGRYEYQLQGLSDSWYNIGDRRSIRFTELKPGSYVLKVKPIDQAESLENMLMVPITVYAPWYATLIAYFVYAILLVSITAAFVRFKLRQQKIKNQLKYDKMQLEKSEELDRVKSTLFANISHELRTPLTLILGPLQAALDGEYWKDEKKIINVLERAQRNGDHLLRIVEQILDMSRLESGKVILNERPTGLEALIKKVYGTFEPLAKAKGIHWEMDYQLSSSQVLLLDEDKFEKIVYNLLSNAFKFSPPGGSVTFKISKGPKDIIEFEIADSGQGISSEDLPNIFGRFFQSSKMDENHAGGSGIGLAFAKELAALLGGDLKAESQFGKGATFTLSLPKRKYEAAAATAETPQSHDIPEVTVEQQSKLNELTATDAHVLIVEDNADMRAFLEEELSPLFQVTTAVDGLDALEKLKAADGKYEMIVSDVMMPRMDGFTLLENLKADAKWHKIPVVLLTAKSAVVHRVKALRIGVDDYITKPFSTLELKVRISNLLQNYRERAQPREAQPEEKLSNLYDANWLEKAEVICQQNIGNSAFGVKDLADQMAISDRQLTRRLKEITGLTPNKYFRAIKLHHAREMVNTGKFRTLSELSYHVGFDDPQYFSRLYKSTFGKSPLEVA